MILQRELLLLRLVTYFLYQKYFEQNLLIFKDFITIFYMICLVFIYLLSQKAAFPLLNNSVV